MLSVAVAGMGAELRGGAAAGRALWLFPAPELCPGAPGWVLKLGPDELRLLRVAEWFVRAGAGFLLEGPASAAGLHQMCCVLERGQKGLSQWWLIWTTLGNFQ